MSDGYPDPLDLTRVRVLPLRERDSLKSVAEILVDPDSAPGPSDDWVRRAVERCARRILRAKERGASVVLAFGAHLIRNGGVGILERMMQRGWLTHLATNGASTIHDWEFAWLGRSTEPVRKNLAAGTFGAWDETGKYLHLALMAGALSGEGYGQSVGRFILEDGTILPDPDELRQAIRTDPDDGLTAARADLLRTMLRQGLISGKLKVNHAWKQASLLAQAKRLQVPVSVHPGIGYDIISNHPIFSGAVIGRAADTDFRLFARALNGLESGVLLSVGSAVMAPQVVEKGVSCVNNLRLQEGRSVLRDHEIFAVDLQPGGDWDWTRSEPPVTSPAYYLRFCKSFSRLGGKMSYVSCDNIVFMHSLYHRLLAS